MTPPGDATGGRCVAEWRRWLRRGLSPSYSWKGGVGLAPPGVGEDAWTCLPPETEDEAWA